MVEVIDKSGTVIEKLKFEPLELTENEQHGFYLVRNYQAHVAHQKTASSKTRSDVSGGGAKPYRQKGTGHARRGSSRTPLRPGGGIAFGPKPQKAHKKLNDDLIKEAIKKALLASLAKIKLIKMQDLDFAAVKKIVKDEDKKLLVITDRSQETVIKAFRNLRKVKIQDANKIIINDIFTVDEIYLDYQQKDLLGSK